MGCCSFRPVTEVLENPSVSAHVEVGDLECFKGNYRWSLRGCSALMYIQDGGLYHHVTYGKTFCCAFCKKRFLLSQIKTVELIKDEVIAIPRGGNSIYLNPGLKITLEETAGSITTLLVAIPEAATFAPQLLAACGLSEKDNF